MNVRDVSCAVCGETFVRTVKQVNQAIKKKGRWACVGCMAGHNRLNLIGRKFSDLTVIAQAASVRKRTAWLCACSCGSEKVVTGNNLTTGHTTSCGCRKRALDASRTRTHGASNSREYRIWGAMRTRCNNPNAINFHNYGGRGIRVCERWDSDFSAFYSDMGPCPPGSSIERVDNDKGYEPGNCIWAGRYEQARNTRLNRVIAFGGRTQCLAAWAEELGLDQSSLRERLEKWPVRRALTEPKLGARA